MRKTTTAHAVQNIRAYLRASTDEQHADRARESLQAFADGKGWIISAWYIENASGTRLERAELNRLLSEAAPGDVLLIEQVDRLTRLEWADWQHLKATITAKGLRIVSLDLPTSHEIPQGVPGDLAAVVMNQLNEMLLEILATMARKDYEDRRRRQAEGIARAKAEGKYTGRKEDEQLQANINDLLAADLSYTRIREITGASRTTIAKVAKRRAAAKAQQARATQEQSL